MKTFKDFINESVMVTRTNVVKDTKFIDLKSGKKLSPNAAWLLMKPYRDFTEDEYNNGVEQVIIRLASAGGVEYRYANGEMTKDGKKVNSKIKDKDFWSF